MSFNNVFHVVVLTYTIYILGWDHQCLRFAGLQRHLDVLPGECHRDDAELREVMASNLCRCTGHTNIVRAVLAASAGEEA